jgi:hypothetical protein
MAEELIFYFKLKEKIAIGLKTVQYFLDQIWNKYPTLYRLVTGMPS